MLKELRWKYRDTKRSLGETAIIGGVDTGFTWGEVVGAGTLVLIVLVFTVGFVIGPTTGDGAETGGSAAPDGAASGSGDGGAGGDTGTGADTGQDGGNADGSNESQSPSGDGVNSTFNETVFENYIHTYVNRERSEQEIDTLIVRTFLREDSRTNARFMRRNTEIAHLKPTLDPDYPECFDEGNFTGQQLVAITYLDREMADGERFGEMGPLANHVVERWMDNNTTRRVLLSDAPRQQGAGAALDDDTGGVYVTLNVC